MAFRSKIKNKFLSQERQTLDAKHNNILTMFNDNKSRLPELENKLHSLNAQIETLQKENEKHIVVDLTIQRKLWSLDDEKNQLQNEIDDIRNNADETKYMLNTGKILNDYYRLLEQEKNHISADFIQTVNIPYNNQKQDANQKQEVIQKDIITDINNIDDIEKLQSSKRKNIIDWFSQTDTNDITFQNIDTGKKKFIIQKKTSLSKNKNSSKNSSKNDINVINKCKTKISPDQDQPEIQIQNSLETNKQTNNNNNSNLNQIMNKDDIYDRYMKIVDKNYININNSKVEVFDVCTICKTEMHLNNNSGLLICPKCGSIENIIVDSDKPSFKEPPKEMTSFCYKRINHLNEFLAQFQAKETTDIHEDVYNEILIEIKKERITNMALITPDKMRALLKKIKKNDYYEHIPYIINQLNGLPAPVIAPEIEEIIRGMFKAIQLPFEKYCPHRRKNFLSYNYVMYKFFELLELDEYLNCFQLLKSRTKLHQQDLIWKNICNDLNWQYIKSL